VLDAKIVQDRATGRSKGFGFVTFHDPATAATVLSAGLHVIEGRQCNVNQASDRGVGEKRSFDGLDGGAPAKRPRFDMPAAGFPVGYNMAASSPYMPGVPGGGVPALGVPGGAAAMYGAYPGAPYGAVIGRPGDNKLFVASLPMALTDQRFGDLLGVFGDVMEAKIVMDRDKNESKGYGFVTFADPSAAARAAACGVLFIDGRRCPCNLSSAKTKQR